MGSKFSGEPTDADRLGQSVYELLPAGAEGGSRERALPAGTGPGFPDSIAHDRLVVTQRLTS